METFYEREIPHVSQDGKTPFLFQFCGESRVSQDGKTPFSSFAGNPACLRTENPLFIFQFCGESLINVLPSRRGVFPRRSEPPPLSVVSAK